MVIRKKKKKKKKLVAVTFCEKLRPKFVHSNYDKNNIIQDDRNVEDFGGYSMQFVTAISNLLL